MNPVIFDSDGTFEHFSEANEDFPAFSHSAEPREPNADQAQTAH